MMDFDLRPLVIMAIIGLIASVLIVIGFIVAVVAYFLGYWSFGITI